MLNGVGFLLILGCVFGSFLMSGGKMAVIFEALPHELLAIVGAAIGAFVVGNSFATVKNAGKGILRSFKGARWKDSDFRDLLTLLFRLLSTFKKGGATGIEPHLDDPKSSKLFAPYPRLLADHHLIEFICDYDPTKAQFTTFINWQIRGELQSLRFRVMTDQRPSAKKVDATTVSLHAITTGDDGGEASLEAMLEDGGALARTEAGASDYLAEAAAASLIEAYIDQQRAAGIAQLRKRPRPKRALRSEPIDSAAVAAQVPRPRTRGLCPIELEKLEQKLLRDKEIVERRVFDVTTLDELGTDTGVTKERVRQITKRAARSIAELASADPRFAMMADYRRPRAPDARSRNAKTQIVATQILPPLGQPHNVLSRLVAIAAPANGTMASMRRDEETQDEIADAMIADANRTDSGVPANRVWH